MSTFKYEEVKSRTILYPAHEKVCLVKVSSKHLGCISPWGFYLDAHLQGVKLCNRRCRASVQTHKVLRKYLYNLTMHYLTSSPFLAVSTSLLLCWMPVMMPRKMNSLLGTQMGVPVLTTPASTLTCRENKYFNLDIFIREKKKLKILPRTRWDPSWCTHAPPSP